jgi:hypothetical protein
MIALVFIFMISETRGQQAAFDQGKQLAQKRTSALDQRIKSGDGKGTVPKFREGFFISKDETANAFAHAKNNEAAQTVSDIHKDRGMYKFDEGDPLIAKSEAYHENPQKLLNEIEIREAGANDYSTEYCEECSDEEYLIKARRTKKRYVYLDQPPYIETSGARCNHGSLAIKITIPKEPDDVFLEDGTFNIVHTGRTVSGAYTYENFLVNGAPLTLQKTVLQNGAPWPNRGSECVMTAHLHQFVLDSPDLIKTLLSGTKDEIYNWGRIGTAYLHHRVVNDTGEHYWIPDDKCNEYEKLTEQGLCRYYSMTEDPPSDKYWKGKKVNGSWGQTVTYACKIPNCKDTCTPLRAKGCEQIGSECIQSVGGHCVKWKQKFRCLKNIRTTGYKFSGKTAFCLGGDCIDSSFQSDGDMIQALGYLSILEAARKELSGTDNVQVFKGRSYSCTRWCLLFKDCCDCGGWGVNLGLTDCDENSKQVAKLRREGKCVQTGTYCAERTVLGVCVRRKTVFCCFANKFAKLLQEQGKPQLGQGFGSPECPDCRGFTAEELGRIDFSKLDLTEIVKDVAESFKPSLDPQKHFAKGNELNKIRESMKELPILKNGSEREGSYLNENMKHLIGSMKVK